MNSFAGLYDRDYEMGEINLSSGVDGVPKFGEQALTEIAEHSAVVFKNVLSLEQREAIGGLTDTPSNEKPDSALDTDDVEYIAPVLAGIACQLMGGLDTSEYRRNYMLRLRRADMPNQEDYRLHSDTNYASLEQLTRLETRPGVRVVYQLLGKASFVGVARGGFMQEDVGRGAFLSDGDGWAIPQDRFTGLPLRVESGKVIFAGHPRHSGRSVGDRLLLIQDVSVPLGTIIPAPFLKARQIREVPIDVAGAERAYLLSKPGRALIAKIQSLYPSIIDN